MNRRAANDSAAEAELECRPARRYGSVLSESRRLCQLIPQGTSSLPKNARAFGDDRGGEMTDKKKPFTDVKGKRETSMHQPDIEGERSWRRGRRADRLSSLPT